jgi:2-(1,2-epoxy-1,2-dihydrophenyl)acetyl-CoA isomerase
MGYQQIQYETRGDVGLITLNRPERLNAWTPTMATELADAIEGANRDRAIGAIVMTGAGRGFCAGADMEDTFQKRIEGGDPGRAACRRRSTGSLSRGARSRSSPPSTAPPSVSA